MATTGQTSTLFRGNTAVAGTVFNVQRVGSQTGTVQCDFAEFATKGFKMEIQGRASSDMVWSILGVFDETDMDNNGAALLSVRLMPQMRAEVISVTNAPAANGIYAVLVQ